MRATNPPPQGESLIDEFTWRDGREWEHGIPSNFFIEPDGTCVEVEFQVEKTLNPFLRKWVRKARTPGEAKKRGRSAKMRAAMRPGWDHIRVEIMHRLVRQKFLDHPELAAWLVATGDAKLVEGNTWHDQFWGDCRCYEQQHFFRIGENHLGKILMQVRAELSGTQ